MTSATLDGNRIVVDTTWRQKSLITQVPGARWKNDRWTVPATYPALVQLASVFGSELEPDEGLRAFGQRLYEQRVLAHGIAQGAVPRPLSSSLADRLSPLQQQGAAWLALSEGAILADGMGSGKTVQTCVAMTEANVGMALVVCPASVKETWRRHVEEWTDLEPVVIDGSSAKRDKLLSEITDGQVAIVNYEITWRHSRLAGYGNIRLTDKEKERGPLNIAWDLVVVDEAHRLVSPKAKQTRAMWAIGDLAERRWALTGTPIANHPGDFWALLRFILPDEWPAKTAYVDRYCATSFSPFGGMEIVGLNVQTREEFWGLISPHFLRRGLEEIMGREIKKTRITRYCSLSPKHRKVYKDFKKEMLAELPDDELLMALDPFAKNGRLVQLASAMLEEDGEGGYRMCMPSPKVDALVELLTDLGDEPLVVYSASKQLIGLAADKLDKLGVRWTKITGDEDSTERSRAEDDFQNGRVRVIFLTRAGAEGITLTASRYVAYMMRDWSMIANEQSEDRIRRWTQEHDEVFVVDLATEDTVDARLVEAFFEKSSMMNEITRDDLEALL